jgi:hypothetical protein
MKHSLVHKRRERISLVLAKSITSPTAISIHLKDVDVDTVKNDLKWMRRNSKVVLSGNALEGYVFETYNTIEQLRDIELELQSLRSKETDLDKKLRIIHELKEVINMRWVIHGDGLTLLSQKLGESNGNKASN